MKIIDLSHKIEKDMSLYSGTDLPELTEVYSIHKSGYKESRIGYFSHIGTHIDFPSHIIEGGKSLEDFDIETFYGKGIVIDARKSSKNLKIGKSYIGEIEKKINDFNFIFFYTGWDRNWKKKDYENYPEIDIELASYLAKLNLKGIGVDTISVEKGEGKTFPIHEIFMKKDILLIENLNNLEYLIGKEFEISIFPIFFPNLDGVPVRAVAIIR